MIFDSPQMAVLREKYQNLPNYEVPDVVLLDRYEGYKDERLLLEDLITKVNKNKQKDWLGKLSNEESNQHIGAWFEIMLYGWLIKYFDVLVEPEILCEYPDFVINNQDQHIVIEARAFLLTPEEREKKQKICRIFESLYSIKKPYIVNLKIKQLGGRIIVNEMVGKVNAWLDSDSEKVFNYQDTLGNIFKLSAEINPTMKKLNVSYKDGLRVNAGVLKRPLRKKAEQHDKLRDAGYPYVIAIFLEPPHLSAGDVSEALFGKTAYLIDLESNQLVDEKLDRSGLHFWRDEIRHKSVSGTLVFRAGYDELKKSRYLQSWYVQNPYANVAINPSIFPVESRFIVVNQDHENYDMDWVS